MGSVSSGDEKESTKSSNIVDKIINDIGQSSSQLMSIFNKNKPKNAETELVEMKIDDEVKSKDKNGNGNGSGINFFDYARQSLGNNELFLDKFAWWKETRAKNKSHAIDAEEAHDAIAPVQDHSLRKTQSC